MKGRCTRSRLLFLATLLLLSLVIDFILSRTSRTPTISNSYTSITVETQNPDVIPAPVIHLNTSTKNRTVFQGPENSSSVNPKHTVLFHRSSFPSNFSESEITVKKTVDETHLLQINGDAKMSKNAYRKIGNESSSLKILRENKSPSKGKFQEKRYLSIRLQGCLGNVLFQYASAYCIARLNNLTLYIQNRVSLRDLRSEDITRPKPGWNFRSLSPAKHHPASMGCTFNPSLMTLKPTSSHHFLDGFFQSWKYFEPCKAEVKRLLLFKDHIVKAAVNIVQNLRQKLPHRIFVGMHVRMEDYLSPQEKKVGRKVAPRDYYDRAMTYFRSRFHNVTFVVIASSPSWFRRNITDAADVVVLQRSSSPAVDMEVLSRMDHVIFTVGTFGWWAAYKNNGTVIGYKDFYVRDSVYGRKMKSSSTNFFYPGWIAL